MLEQRLTLRIFRNVRSVMNKEALRTARKPVKASAVTQTSPKERSERSADAMNGGIR